MTCKLIHYLLFLTFSTTIVCGQGAYFLVVSPTSVRKLSDVVTPLMSGLSNAVAMDYDAHTQQFFFSDVRQDFIKRANLDGTNVVTIANSTVVTTPDGIACDWTARNVYWTDTGTDEISVARYDGSNRLVLINTNLDEPRAISLHPMDGLMFWSDWGAIPKLERADMDGSNRRTIVTSSLGWPNGLTVDYDARKLYWIDAKMDKIERANFDGSNRQLVIDSIPHGFGLTLYGQYLYWTDWGTGKLERCSKSDGTSRSTVASGFYRPMAVEVVSVNRQNGSTQCTVNNGGCSKLCLVTPSGPKCMPDGTTPTSPPPPPDQAPTGITSPASEAFDEGSPKRISCQTITPSYPKTLLQWSGSSGSNVLETVHTQPNGTLTTTMYLTMAGAKHLNGAVVTCTARYKGTLVYTTTTRLTIYYAPTSITWIGTSALEVIENQSTTLRCRADESNPYGSGTYGTMQFRKMLNGQTTTQTSRRRMFSGSNGGQSVEISLTLTPQRADNGAIYWCQMEFSYMTRALRTLSSTRKTLQVWYPIQVALTTSSTTVKEGSHVVLTCETSGGNPSAASSISWTLDGALISGENGRTLTRSPINRQQAGLYSCTVENRAGTNSSQLNIRVLYPPQVNVSVTPLKINEGDTVTFTCATTGGNPSTVLSYTWAYNGRVIPGENGRTFVRTLIQRNQGGTYACSVNSEGGPASAQTTVGVQYAGRVIVTTTPTVIKEGVDVTFRCAVADAVSDVYTWYFNGTKISGATGSTYAIKAIKRSLSGVYQCSHQTATGPAEGEKRISVLYKPELDAKLANQLAVGVELGKDASLQFHVVAYPTALTISCSRARPNKVTVAHTGTVVTLTVSSVTQSDYGDYQCSVTNTAGTGVFKLRINPSGPPEMPKDFKYMSNSNVSVTLSWRSGFSGSSSQTFILEFSTGASDIWSQRRVPDPGYDRVVHVQIDKLARKTLYKFKVKAVNDQGLSSQFTEEVRHMTRGEHVEFELTVDNDKVTVTWESTVADYQHAQVSVMYTVSGRPNEIQRTEPAPFTDGELQFSVVGSVDWYKVSVTENGQPVFSSQNKRPPARHVGEPEPKDNTIIFAAVGGVLGVVFLALLAAVIIYVVRRTTLTVSDREHLHRRLSESGVSQSSGSGSPAVVQPIDNPTYNADDYMTPVKLGGKHEVIKGVAGRPPMPRPPSTFNHYNIEEEEEGGENVYHEIDDIARNTDGSVTRQVQD